MAWPYGYDINQNVSFLNVPAPQPTATSQIVSRVEIMQIRMMSSDNEIIEFLHADVRGVEIKGCDLLEIT